MKIEQPAEFQPIVLTLETKEEAQQFWGLLLHCATLPQGPLKLMTDQLYSWFRNNTHF